VRAKKRPQKWRRSFRRSTGRDTESEGGRARGHKSGEGVLGEARGETQRAKGGVLQRGHKSGAQLLRETGGENRAKVCVRERGHKSGAAVSSNSDMQIGVPAEYFAKLTLLRVS
jgi:hypothetical protein